MHPDEGHTHHDVADHGDQNEEGVEAGVHVGVGGIDGDVGSEVQEAPCPGVLQFAPPHAHAGQGTEEDIGHIDGTQGESGQLLVHIVVVEVGMVDGQVALDGHGTDDAQPGQPEEQQNERAVFAHRRPARPLVLQVGGDGDRADQAGAQQVGDGQSAHQSVEGALLLLLAGLTQDDDGDQVPHHPEDEHDGRDSQGPAGYRAPGAVQEGRVQRGEHGGDILWAHLQIWSLDIIHNPTKIQKNCPRCGQVSHSTSPQGLSPGMCSSCSSVLRQGLPRWDQNFQVRAVGGIQNWHSQRDEDL